MWVREAEYCRGREDSMPTEQHQSFLNIIHVPLPKGEARPYNAVGWSWLKENIIVEVSPRYCCYISNSKHWFTTSFLGGRCRKATLGVWLHLCHNCRYHNSRVSAEECCCFNIHFELEICVYADTNVHLLNQFYICRCKNDAETVLQQQNQLCSNLRLLLSTVFVATNICSCSCKFWSSCETTTNKLHTQNKQAKAGGGARGGGRTSTPRPPTTWVSVLPLQSWLFSPSWKTVFGAAKAKLSPQNTRLQLL